MRGRRRRERRVQAGAAVRCCVCIKDFLTTLGGNGFCIRGETSVGHYRDPGGDYFGKGRLGNIRGLEGRGRAFCGMHRSELEKLSSNSIKLTLCLSNQVSTPMNPPA